MKFASNALLFIALMEGEATWVIDTMSDSFGTSADYPVAEYRRELEVISPLVNFALGKPTSQSSTGNWGPNYSYLAVDGNTNGRLKGGSVTHTKGTEAPWWEVDLLDLYPISQINLYGRTDCCQYRSNYVMVTILNDGIEVWRYNQGGVTPPDKLVLNEENFGAQFIVGNKVRVSKPYDHEPFISIAELEVLGYSLPDTETPSSLPSPKPTTIASFSPTTHPSFIPSGIPSDCPSVASTDSTAPSTWTTDFTKSPTVTTSLIGPDTKRIITVELDGIWFWLDNEQKHAERRYNECWVLCNELKNWKNAAVDMKKIQNQWKISILCTKDSCEAFKEWGKNSIDEIKPNCWGLGCSDSIERNRIYLDMKNMLQAILDDESFTDK